MNKDENLLFDEYKAGNEFALEEIFKQNKPLINKIVRKYFLIGADFEDLMQEGMLGLYRAIITFDSLKQANFTTYAKVCIERAVINAIKSANSKKNLPLNNSISLFANQMEGDDEEEVFIVWDDNNPESILINKEKYNKLFDKATQNLSVFEKNVLELYLDGLSYVEIAQKLDKQPKSIDNALTRIKAKISSQNLTNYEE